MRSLFTFPSRSVRQRNVVLLSIALLSWMWALATHTHAQDEHSSSSAAHACIVCHAPAAVAPPPAMAGVQPTLELVIDEAASPAEVIPSLYFPASYRSRAPPRI